MAEILKGKPVADRLNKETSKIITNLDHKPTLSVIRVGENEDDISYEKAIIKRCEKNNINCKCTLLADDISKSDYLNMIKDNNVDKEVDGIILLNQIYKEALSTISVNKDIDGCNPINLSSSFLNDSNGFIPCTAQAVMEMLDYYDIKLEDKNVTVVGRSMTVGKPLSMLLLNKNATVTICHSHTNDIKQHTLNSDIVITAIGKAEMFDKTYFREGQVVIDVGINYSEKKQKICGDVLFEEVEQVVSKITPVPLGVGSVTNAILINHLAKAALRNQNEH